MGSNGFGLAAYTLRKMAEEKRRADAAAAAAGRSSPRPEAERRHIPAAQRRLLFELVQARLSVEAFTAELIAVGGKSRDGDHGGTNRGGLKAEYASRDNTYWYRWE